MWPSSWLPVAGVAAACVLSGCGGTPSAGQPVPDETRVLVALPLKVDRAGLAAVAEATADPRSARYRRFTTVSDIARSYGAKQSLIRHDRAALSGMGIALAVDPTHVALWGPVTAAQVERFFGTTLVEQEGIIQPSGPARIPTGLTGVAGVVGLTATASSSAPADPGAASGPCPSEIPTRSSTARLFGFRRAIAAGANGAGTKIDIVSTNRLETAGFAAYNRCTGASLSTDNIAQTHVPGTPPTDGGDEIALDSIVLTLLAPEARLNITRFDAATSLAFPLMQLSSTEPATPDILDITEVYCENRIAPADLALSEWLLAAYAATGTTSVAAAGDTGSSGCYPSDTAPAVTYPASSAFVAGVGGASYSGSAPSPQALRVWNEPEVAGGGGGTSESVGAPGWQSGSSRAVPDVSAYATPGGIGSIPVCTTPSSCTWKDEGGTSLSATVLGAAGVLFAQQRGVTGAPARWGNLAGLLWRQAKGDRALADITSGGNTTHTKDCCTATPGYDTASGWGLLDPNRLRLGPARRP